MPKLDIRDMGFHHKSRILRIYDLKKQAGVMHVKKTDKDRRGVIWPKNKREKRG
jgi:hypothetical protein